MAFKLALPFIFALLAFSYAQDFPNHDVHDVTNLPESDSKITNIFLPSHKTQPQDPEIQPETDNPVNTITEPVISEIEPDTNKPVDTKIGSVPLTFVTFRPINRHFHHRPVFPLRRCGRGLQRGMVKPWLMRIDGGEIPYAKDMIVEKDVEHGDVRKMPMPLNLKMERFQLGSEMEEFPLRRHRHHHHHHHQQRFHVEEEDDEEEEHHHHHHHHDHDHGMFEEEDHHHHHHDHDHGMFEEEEHHHHHHDHDHDHGSLLGKIRKFLHHF